MKINKFIPFLIVLILFTSCVTKTETPYNELTATQAINSLKGYMVNQAYYTLSSETLKNIKFYPSFNETLFANESDIPGTREMLGFWDDYARSFTQLELQNIMDELANYLDKIQIEDPYAFVAIDSKQTLTALLKENYYSKIENFIFTTLTNNIDLTTYQRLLKQYNAYLETKAYINDDVFVPYTYDIINYLAPLLTSNIFEVLKEAENYSRTTPLPYLEENYINIFHLSNQIT